jgi:molecular chaperone GrpE
MSMHETSHQDATMPNATMPNATMPSGDEYAEPTAPQDAEQVMQAATGRIAELEAEIAEMRDRWVRSEAEIQNVRTRARKDVEDARLYAVQGFARDVVEAAENIKRGLESVPPAAADEADIVGKLRDGFAGVERSFVALRERNGIKRTDPTGAMFDPNLHQAMSEQETVDHPPGTVLQAWTAAWTLNGRLLRPAMVVVAKAAPAEITDSAASSLNTTA